MTFQLVKLQIADKVIGSSYGGLSSVLRSLTSLIYVDSFAYADRACSVELGNLSSIGARPRTRRGISCRFSRL